MSRNFILTVRRHGKGPNEIELLYPKRKDLTHVQIKALQSFLQIIDGYPDICRLFQESQMIWQNVTIFLKIRNNIGVHNYGMIEEEKKV